MNTPLSKTDRSSKQDSNNDIEALNNALDEMDLTDTYTTFHPKEANTHSFQMHINILKDRTHDRTQNKSRQIQEN